MKPTIFSLFAAAAILASGAFAADPIKIGVIGPLSGGSSPMGISMRNAAQLAAREINAAGGVLGRPLELVERDDAATNERGAQLTLELIESQKVVAITGFANTGVAKASARYPTEKHVPLLINVTTGIIVNDYFKDADGKDQENYLFSITLNDTLQSAVLVHEVVDLKGYKKIALLCDDTAYGQSGRVFVEAELKKRGITPVSVSKFKLKDTDMTPQLQEAKAAGAEVLIAYGIGPEDAQIANGRIKLGWAVPMFGSWAMSMSNYIDNAGPNGDGTFCVQTFIQDDPRTEKQKSFLADYAREFKPDAGRIPSAMSAAQGYDAIYLLAAAIKQAGNTEGKAIKEALENLKTPIVGVSTTYTTPFSATDHIALKREAGRMGMVKEGKVVPASR